MKTSRHNTWSDHENDIIVADYFEMLMLDLKGQYYNKADHNRQIREKLHRTKGSIEYKHQNISAALRSLGETWIPGYKPATNYQQSLFDAIDRWLRNNPSFWNVSIPDAPSIEQHDPLEITLVKPPILEHSPPNTHEAIRPDTLTYNMAERAKRNSIIGRAGEERVLVHERARLNSSGRSDLAKKVRWVSEEDGDGAGYDIESYTLEGHTRLIEVKSTVGCEHTPFYITRNELAVAEERSNEWYLFRLWNLARTPKAFELRWPINDHVKLYATSYEARFR